MNSANANGIKPVGPSSCGGCKTSCFGSKTPLGMEYTQFTQEQKDHVEKMQKCVKVMDMNYRTGKIEDAKRYRDIAWKLYTRAAIIFEGKERAMYLAFGKMIKEHCSSVEVQNFMNAPAIEAYVRMQVQIVSARQSQKAVENAVFEIKGIFERSVANLQKDEVKLEKFYADFENWIFSHGDGTANYILERLEN